MKPYIPFISGLLTVSLLFSGCSTRSVHTNESTEYEHVYNEGDIYYELNPERGLSVDTENLSSYFYEGYFILHDGVFYPVYSYNSPGALELGKSSSKSRFEYFTSENINNIPTLFEGDKLYYYSAGNVYDYSTLERFKEWGWTVGIKNMKSNTTGHVYVHMPSYDDYKKDGGDLYSPEFNDIYDHIGENGGNILIDKIGNVKFTSDFIKDGMVYGLTEGAPYDFEMYKGTNYMYYHVSANIYAFQGFESYAIWEYTPLQDFLYEIKIPDYLLNGYYDIDGRGMFRLVRGDYYNESTDFNEKLLYSTYPPGFYSEAELAELEEIEAGDMPKMYSENDILNSFVAYDETCFGYRGEETVNEEPEAISQNFTSELEAAFLEASTTVTDIWLPMGSDCTISIITEEKTGKVILKTADEKKRNIPYDRIAGAYKLQYSGKGEKAQIIVQGLYNDYTIKLVGCEQYRNQDEVITIEESLPGADDETQAPGATEPEGVEETNDKEPASDTDLKEDEDASTDEVPTKEE